MTVSRSTAWAGLAALAIIAMDPGSARAGFTITDLGAVVSPGSVLTPVSINAAGEAAGTISLPNGGISAALAMPGGKLSAITAPPGATSSVATSISGSGTVAGNYTASNGQGLGFTSSGGLATSVGPLTTPGGTSGTFTQVNAINGSGQVAGSGNLPTVANSRAFYTTGSTVTMLSPVGSSPSSTMSNWAYGINSGGTVVGTSEKVAGGLQQAFYTGPDGTPIALTTRNSAADFQSATTATAIANNGDIVGSGDVGGYNHGFFASAAGGAMVDLGTLGNSPSSQALAVNDNGLVVGKSGTAFLWAGSEGMVDLNTLIPPASQSQWVLTIASGINDSDQIAGVGLLNGVLHGFILTPIPDQPLFSQPGTVPAPPALVLATIGLAIASRWRRSKVRGGS